LLNFCLKYVVIIHLRENIEQTDFKKVGQITCGVGLSEHRIGDTEKEWIHRVDEALYKAKANDRNRVEIS